MKVDHAAKIQGGEQVAVHHDEGVCQVRDERERAGSAERFVFADVLDALSNLRSDAAHSMDELGEIARADGDIDEAGSRESPQQNLDNGFVTERHQRLWENRRQWPEPGSFSPGQNHRTDRAIFFHRNLRPRSRGLCKIRDAFGCVPQLQRVLSPSPPLASNPSWSMLFDYR